MMALLQSQSEKLKAIMFANFGVIYQFAYRANRSVWGCVISTGAPQGCVPSRFHSAAMNVFHAQIRRWHYSSGSDPREWWKLWGLEKARGHYTLYYQQHRSAGSGHPQVSGSYHLIHLEMEGDYHYFTKNSPEQGVVKSRHLQKSTSPCCRRKAF